MFVPASLFPKKMSRLTSKGKVEMIHRQITFDDAFHHTEALKVKKKNRMEETSNYFMDICCFSSLSYSWSTCLCRSGLKSLKYTRLHGANFISSSPSSASRAQDMNEWINVNDVIKTRDAEQDECELTDWDRLTLIMWHCDPVCDWICTCSSYWCMRALLKGAV